MRWGKRISQLLLLIVLCVLIFYVGIYLQVDVSGETYFYKINQTLLDNAGEMYLAGLFYSENSSDGLNDAIEVFHQAIIEHAFRLMPLGKYVNAHGKTEIQTEDSKTYEMILAMQASDENEVDENGKLIENTTNEDGEKDFDEQDSVRVSQTISKDKLNDYEYLVSNFYTVDSSTSVNDSLLNAKKLLKKDLTIDTESDGPKILIYHTHSQEAFKDSKKGDMSETIMGMGAYLAEILNEEYGIETLHHEGIYDLINGNLDRSKAYQLALPEIEELLKENPSIEVVIDLHRDGVKESTHLVTEIDGKKTAQIMFFNGMSRTRANGDIAYLHNPYIEDNLAFSLQMQLASMEMYPGYTRRIYLKSYRYNMHLLPKTLLVEAGAQTNTVAEMKRSMKVLAEILHHVLTE